MCYSKLSHLRIVLRGFEMKMDFKQYDLPTERKEGKSRSDSLTHCIRQFEYFPWISYSEHGIILNITLFI